MLITRKHQRYPSTCGQFAELLFVDLFEIHVVTESVVFGFRIHGGTGTLRGSGATTA